MTTSTFEPNIDTLMAQPHDDPMGIHVLSEFTFCPRAGLNTAEVEQGDRGQDESHIPPLDFQPAYDPGAIDRHIRVYSTRVLTWAVAVVVLTGLTTRWLSHSWLPWLAGMGLDLACLVFGVSDAIELLKWWWQRWKSLTSEDWLPDPDDPRLETFNWWQLYRAGFTSVPTHGGIHDEKLQLSGQPFKLLQRGNEYVPVFLRRGDGSEIYPQHYVRMAAYCLLLQRQTGGMARYGVVLRQGTFDCVAIKFNRESFQLLTMNLTDARQALRNFRQLGQWPSEPDSVLCRRCPFGKPLNVDSPESLELIQLTNLSPHAGIGHDGRRYHCHCGDRFKWTPPHQRVADLGIPR